MHTPQIPDYRRNRVPGGTFFFTVNLLDRRSNLLVTNIDALRDAVRSLAEPFLDTTSDFAEIIFATLGVAAKLERRRILERTARGRADAKEKGVKFGRKPTLTLRQQKEARARFEAGETQRSVARSYNVSQTTISRLVA
jgi:DNA invertase Pin-like site-specific DNA recombinase